MRTFISIPIFIALLILQTAVLRQIPLLQGSGDLVLLALTGWALQRRVNTAWYWGLIASILLGFFSTIPIYVYLVGYLLVVAIATIVRQRLLSTSWVVMLVMVFIGTLVTQFLELFYLRAVGSLLPILPSINLIIIPSILLNLLLALPFFILMGDLARFLYPEPLEA